MNVLHLNTSDIDGGAARAAYRLHQGLRAIGVSSQMLVRAKFSTEKSVVPEKTALTKLGPLSNTLPLKLYPNRDRTLFSPQWFPDTISSKVKQLKPDLVHLHWVNNGYLQVETLARLRTPLVWTLHDMWAFTGGCHYTQECNRYTNSCGVCPQLKSNRNWDLSRWIWQRKMNAWKNLNLTIVSPSHWLADCAKSSSLFNNLRVEVIPHGLDVETYRPIDRQVARNLLNLPQDKHLILFGAAAGTTTDLRKGFHLLSEALERLGMFEFRDTAELVIFGASQTEKLIDLGYREHYLGRIHDDLTLALIYSAADVMVVPSLQEAFGQTASEALACGTPVVAFNATGLKDIVNHQQNGYLAKPFDAEDLASGIAWVLGSEERHQKLSYYARKKVEEEFTLQMQARRYLSLFTEIFAASSNVH